MLKKPGMKLGLCHRWEPGPMFPTTISHTPLSGAAVRPSGSPERQKDFTVISEVCEVELLMRKVLFAVGGWPSGNCVMETLRKGGMESWWVCVGLFLITSHAHDNAYSVSHYSAISAYKRNMDDAAFIPRLALIGSWQLGSHGNL